MPLIGHHETVYCAVCFKRIPKSAAAMAETSHEVAYFCSRECYDKWMAEPRLAERAQPALPREEPRR